MFFKRGMDKEDVVHDSVGGGAWPFLVGGAICLVNSDNERDSGMLTSYAAPCGRRPTS